MENDGRRLGLNTLTRCYYYYYYYINRMVFSLLIFILKKKPLNSN